MYYSVGISDTVNVVVDDSRGVDKPRVDGKSRARRFLVRRNSRHRYRQCRENHPCSRPTHRRRPRSAILAPVGIAVDVVVATIESTNRSHVPRIIFIVRARRHLFISSDIRIKAFTFNQN